MTSCLLKPISRNLVLEKFSVCARVEVSYMERKKDLSVNCVELIVKGTGGNESTERNGAHDEE